MLSPTFVPYLKGNFSTNHLRTILTTIKPDKLSTFYHSIDAYRLCLEPFLDEIIFLPNMYDGKSFYHQENIIGF